MSTRVNIEAKAWTDHRFATLARFVGLADAEHALIRCAKIWAWQTENFTPEAPTYTVDADLIETIVGPGAPAAMVRAKLAEEVPEGYRIKGSLGRIEWLWQRRTASAKGGEVTKRKIAHERGPEGPVVARPNQGPLSSDLRILTPDPTPDVQVGSPDTKRSTSEIRTGGVAEIHNAPPAPLRLAHPPRVPMPRGWKPSRCAVTTAAESAARARGVDVDLARDKFVERSRAAGKRAADWDAEWRLCLLTEFPSQAQSRPTNALSQQLQRVARLEALERQEAEHYPTGPPLVVPLAAEELTELAAMARAAAANSDEAAAALSQAGVNPTARTG